MSREARTSPPATTTTAQKQPAITAVTAHLGPIHTLGGPADRFSTCRRVAVVALVEVDAGVTHEEVYQRIAMPNVEGIREVYLDVDPDWARYSVLRENAGLDEARS